MPIEEYTRSCNRKIGRLCNTHKCSSGRALVAALVCELALQMLFYVRYHSGFHFGDDQMQLSMRLLPFFKHRWVNNGFGQNRMNEINELRFGSVKIKRNQCVESDVPEPLWFWFVYFIQFENIFLTVFVCSPFLSVLYLYFPHWWSSPAWRRKSTSTTATTTTTNSIQISSVMSIPMKC